MCVCPPQCGYPPLRSFVLQIQRALEITTVPVASCPFHNAPHLVTKPLECCTHSNSPPLPWWLCVGKCKWNLASTQTNPTGVRWNHKWKKKRLAQRIQFCQTEEEEEKEEDGEPQLRLSFVFVGTWRCTGVSFRSSPAAKQDCISHMFLCSWRSVFFTFRHVCATFPSPWSMTGRELRYLISTLNIRRQVQFLTVHRVCQLSFQQSDI